MAKFCEIEIINIKELRERNISNIDQANDFLEEYMVVYNRKFAVEPARHENAHREVLAIHKEKYLFMKTEDRKLSKDLSFQYSPEVYQIDSVDKRRLYGKKVQIIEDESHIKALLIQTLETAFEDIIDDEELEILEANDGVEGLKIAKQEHPDLIFLDIMIPKIDGFEVCKKLKEDPSYKNTYIIMLTAKGQVVDKEKGLSVGANEYVTKPFNPDFIISKVEEKLGFKRTY